MNFKALLFDTRSIQRYIYSSNRLRANIGASYLVDKVFKDVLVGEILKGNEQKKGLFFGDVDDDSRRSLSPVDWAQKKKCRVAYIGGGNALVLFSEDVPREEIEKVVTEFTKRLLQSHPGLRTGAAIGEMRIDPDGHYLDKNENKLTTEEIKDGKDDLTMLVRKLKQYQNSVFPEVHVPYTGLTQICPELGEAATAWDVEKKRFCSQEFKAKLDVWRNAEDAIAHKIQKVLPEEKKYLFQSFKFPAELEKLGQRETENYIAIVHIDGNNMGVRFANCDTLTARKNLSLRLSEKTTKAFAAMLCKAVDEYDGYNGFLDLGEENGKKILPVRPLVLGGDDMTFICTAKLALRYTRRIMETMLDESAGERVDTCAGIAIQPASYPFFRGYTLAEQACDAAKKEMRALRDKGTEQSCWLDFVIRHGEQAPSLSQIREQEYRSKAGYLHFGPYRTDASKDDEKSLENLTAGLDSLKKEYDDTKSLAMNKIKKLRDIIRHGDKHEWQKYLQRLEERHDSLPDIPAWREYAENLWKNETTPYVDLIEMLDFYEPEGDESHDGK